MLSLLWLLGAFNFFTVSAHVLSSPPVLIWGMKTPEAKKIFRPVTNKQFYSLIRKIQKEHMLVVYFASELAAKDLNCEMCFSHLQVIKPMNYYSQVEEPLNALQRVSETTNKIIWHKPMITNQTEMELKMKVPCQQGQIHAFDFKDRNLLAHDQAMGVSNSQLVNCSVVHAYTAFTEESQSFMRRKIHSINLRSQSEPSYRHRDGGEPLADHFSSDNSSRTDNLIILRRERVILAFNNIMLATRESTGKLAPVIRRNLTLNESDDTMQVGMYNQPNLDAGLVLILETNISPLVIEVLPVKGNWYLTRAILDETTFYPSDLIFFSFDFSLCCSDVTFFASNRSVLTLFNIHLDIITSPNEDGMMLTYKAKPCWSCAQFVSSTLTQTILIMLLFVAILGIGMSFITSIGRNELIQVAADPDLYIKTDQ